MNPVTYIHYLITVSKYQSGYLRGLLIGNTTLVVSEEFWATLRRVDKQTRYELLAGLVLTRVPGRPDVRAF